MLSKPSKLEDEASRLEALSRLEAVTRTSEASFDKLTRLVQLILQTPIAVISLIDAEHQIMKARQGIDLKSCSRSDSFCNIAIRSYEPLVIENALEDERVRDNIFVLGPPYLRSYIGAPLTTSDGYNLGTICAFDMVPKTFNQREIEIIQKCADLVVEQLELRAQANTDYLTKLYNRRSFTSEMKHELVRRRRTPGSSVLAFLDIDHFKRVNDTFGHPVGDQVLREFSAVVSSECRENDMIARFGGEEFAVLLSDTNIEEARGWAERTREKISQTAFGDSHNLTLTVSIGLAGIGEQEVTLDAINSMADEALYQAKSQGRNCVVVRPS